jgi:hypothetical protein
MAAGKKTEKIIVKQTKRKKRKMDEERGVGGESS